MRAVAILNAVDITPYAHRPFRDGRSVFDLALQTAREMEGVEGVVVLAGPVTPEIERAAAGTGAAVRPREQWDAAALLRQIHTEAAGYDTVYHLHADTPYVDKSIASRMLANHIRYYADYTFADGYPVGLCPEILKPAVLGPLVKLADGQTGRPTRDVIFQVVQKDINAFDLETELSPVDLRPLRLTLAADTKRNHLLLERLEQNGARTAEEVIRIVSSTPQILRTLPAYYNVQIVEGCPQLCSYCPYPATLLKARGVRKPGKVDEMERERFAGLVEAIRGFAGDAVVSVSLWGEPSLHSRIGDLVTDAATMPGIAMQIETSGVGWSRDTLERIHASGARPVWIVSLDAWGPEQYARLRGEGFAEALQTVDILHALSPDSTYVQAVRMRGSEEDTESFYRGWKERGVKTIVQKYDAFAGRLPDLKVSDLSPIKRNPCWHLMRDLVVQLDGSVPMCREVLGSVPPLGNAFTDGIASVWARGEELYNKHLAERYPAPCQTCDEYYTYNA